MFPAGPCLPHCYACSPLTVFAARASFVYVVACVVYLLTTMRIGTPFSDSLSPEQRKIKNASARVRKMHFLRGIGVGLATVCAFRPFTPV